MKPRLGRRTKRVLLALTVATTAFALGQAAAAYGFAYIFAHTGGTYRVLFALGAAALATALVIDVSMARLFTRPRRAGSE